MKEEKAIRLVRELLAGAVLDGLTLDQVKIATDRLYTNMDLIDRGAWLVSIGKRMVPYDERPKGMSYDVAKALGIPALERREDGFHVLLRRYYPSEAGGHGAYTKWEWKFPDLQSAWNFILREKAKGT